MSAPTVSIRYIGPLGAVVIPEHDEEIAVEHGGTLAVREELAARLLEQPSNWERATPAKAPKP